MPADYRKMVQIGIPLALVALCSFTLYVTEPFWMDETITGGFSCQPSFSAMMPLITHDAHPVLYHVLIHLIFLAAGCHLWIVRFLSLTASLLGAYLVLREVGRSGGNIYLAGALTLGNPTFWHYALEGRPYGLLYLCGAGVVAYGLADSTNHRIKAVCFAALGAALHYVAIMLMPALAAISLMGQSSLSRSRSFWIAYGAAIVAIGIYYGLQVSTAFANGKQSHWISPPSLTDLVVFPAIMFGGVVAAMAVITLAVVTLGGLLVAGRQVSRQGIMLSALFAGSVLALLTASFSHPMFIYRYVYCMTPFGVVGASLLLRDAQAGITVKRPQWSRSFEDWLFMLIVAYLVIGLFNIVLMPPHRPMTWERAMDQMACTVHNPCGFVLDDPLETFLTLTQQAAMANILAPTPGTFAVIHPADMAAWINSHPGVQILYVRSFRPVEDIGKLQKDLPLQCSSKFLIHGIGGMPCQIAD